MIYFCLHFWRFLSKGFGFCLALPYMCCQIFVPKWPTQSSSNWLQVRLPRGLWPWGSAVVLQREALALPTLSSRAGRGVPASQRPDRETGRAAAKQKAQRWNGGSGLALWYPLVNYSCAIGKSPVWYRSVMVGLGLGNGRIIPAGVTWLEWHEWHDMEWPFWNAHLILVGGLEYLFNDFPYIGNIIRKNWLSYFSEG